MSTLNQFWGCLGLLVMIFPFLRFFLGGMILYQLNNSAYRKRVKGQSIVEWFAYSRFKEEIPKVWRVVYWLVICVYTVGMLICVLLPAIGLSYSYGEVVLKILTCFFCLIAITPYVWFYNPRKKKMDYGRWINKRRGQK